MSSLETMPATAQYKKALETILFITDHPLTLDKLGKIIGLKDGQRLREMIDEISADLSSRDSSLRILEIAEGFQMATDPEFSDCVRKLYSDRLTMKLSSAAHETLAIIAYKQPLTRAEIEEVRGVEVIAALETLLEKRLIRVVGRKESVGRPLMYGTTPEFMRHFGLKSIKDMPPLENFAVEPPVEASAVQSEAQVQLPDGLEQEIEIRPIEMSQAVVEENSVTPLQESEMSAQDSETPLQEAEGSPDENSSSGQ